MISATLDSSVYIRALHLRGPAAILIGQAKVGELRIDLSEPIVTETIGVLRDVFKWDGYSLNDARQKLMSLANYDPPDNRILECAATAMSDFIISEDKDILRLKRYRRSQFLTVHDFLNLAPERISRDR